MLQRRPRKNSDRRAPPGRSGHPTSWPLWWPDRARLLVVRRSTIAVVFLLRNTRATDYWIGSVNLVSVKIGGNQGMGYFDDENMEASYGDQSPHPLFAKGREKKGGGGAPCAFRFFIGLSFYWLSLMASWRSGWVISLQSF